MNKEKLRKRKRRTKTSHHMTITVPKELRERMDNYQAEKYVNWSAIAAEAFESYLYLHKEPTK